MSRSDAEHRVSRPRRSSIDEVLGELTSWNPCDIGAFRRTHAGLFSRIHRSVLILGVAVSRWWKL